MMIRHESNLYFDREQDGDVRLLKLKYPPTYDPKPGKPHWDTDNVEFDIRVRWQTWCRLIAHVSHDKNGVGRWYEASEFHMRERNP
jgi:hypothetical protein